MDDPRDIVRSGQGHALLHHKPGRAMISVSWRYAATAEVLIAGIVKIHCEAPIDGRSSPGLGHDLHQPHRAF